MSTTCNVLLINSTLSPTSKQQQAATGGEADLCNQYTHHVDSPRGAAHFCKRPSIKWPKAVLAPLRLLPAPIRSSTRRPCSGPTSTQRRVPAAPSCAPGNILSPSAQLDAGPRVVATGLPITTAPLDETNQVASCSSSPLTINIHSANDVEQLLHILSLSNDINTRSRILTALCTLYASASARGTAVHKFVAAGGIEIILNILNTSTAQPSSQYPSPPAIVEEESEKALILLHLSTSSSQDACAAALQHTASVIAALGKKLLRISETCTASAIAVLTSLSHYSDSTTTQQPFRKAVSKTAIPSKLVVVLQVASKESTKRRAARLLRLLGEEQEQGQEQQVL